MDHSTYLQNAYQNALPGGEDEELALLQTDAMLMPGSPITGNSRTTSAASRIKVPILVAMSLWLVIMAVELSPFLFIVRTGHQEATHANTSRKDDDDDAYDALWGSSVYFGVFGIRMCTLDECASSPCQKAKSAPFACLSLQHSDHVRGGCGANPWTNEICAEQCDATGCSHLLKNAKALAKKNKKKHREDRTHVVDHCDVECPKEWCGQQRLCGDENASYQCTTGVSIYGCSSDKYQWTVRSSEADCSACCKTTSCS